MLTKVGIFLLEASNNLLFLNKQMKPSFNLDKTNFSFQRIVAIIGLLLFFGKLLAWRVTKSDAVFSDAMESIVNIIAAFMGLYSLYLAAKPKDEEHPYGHGKVEFITSGIEGALIIFAGVVIIVQAINSLLDGNIPGKLDWGMMIVTVTAIANYVLGYISILKGKKHNSLVLQSSGKHLQSDTITTMGVVISLLIVQLTKIYWIDGVVAIVFGVWIMYIGYKIIRQSLRGIMDEADVEMISRLADILDEGKKDKWIDMHNTKIQQFGGHLHIDAHLTFPYYYELREAHNQMEEVIKLVVSKSRRSIEFNFHMDDCKPISCAICPLKECPVRSQEFVGRVKWDVNSITQPDKHTFENL